jgi:protein phosphatase-4 regulatory subunit 3
MAILDVTTFDLAAIRFFKACIKANNHFLHRHLTKHDLMLALLDMLEVEGPRDNMLCSSCLDVLELIRSVSA